MSDRHIDTRRDHNDDVECGFPQWKLTRNKLAASADAFTHLGEKWEASETFMDGACANDKDPQLASAAWSVTDGKRHTAGLVLGLQTATRGGGSTWGYRGSMAHTAGVD